MDYADDEIHVADLSRETPVVCLRCGVLYTPAYSVGRLECRVHTDIVDAKGAWKCCGVYADTSAVGLLATAYGAPLPSMRDVRGCTRADHSDRIKGPPTTLDAGIEIAFLAPPLASAWRPGAGPLVTTRAEVRTHALDWLARHTPPGMAPAPTAADEWVNVFVEQQWRTVLDVNGRRGAFPLVRLLSLVGDVANMGLIGRATREAFLRRDVRDLFLAFMAEYARPPIGTLGVVAAGARTPVTDLLLHNTAMPIVFYRQLATAVQWLCERASDPMQSGTLVGRNFLTQWRDDFVPTLMATLRPLPLPLLPFRTLRAMAVAPETSVLLSAATAQRIILGAGNDLAPDAPGPDLVPVPATSHTAFINVGSRRHH